MRLLLPLLVLLAICLGLFVLLTSDPGTAPTGPGPAAAPPPAPERAPAELDLPAPDDPLPAEPAPSREELGAPEVAGPGPAAEDGTLLVEVVAGEDDLPVPGCTVYALELADAGEESRRLFAGRHDIMAVLRELARSYRTDEDGLVRIPKPDTRLFLAGEAPGLFHAQHFPDAPGMARLTLHLEPEKAVEVLVLDAEGRPRAQVPVVVRAVEGVHDMMPVTRQHTGADGRAVLRCLPPEVEPRLDEDATWEVAVEAPLPQEVSAPLDLDALPREPVVLRLPPAGSAVVEVLDLQGRPAPDGTPVLLGKADPEAVDMPPDPYRGDADGYATAETARGQAVFPVVGVGVRLQALALLEGFPAPVATEADGPRQAGEEVRIRLQPERGPVWFTGRLLDAEGRPVAEEEIYVRLQVVPHRYRSVEVSKLRTGADGRFRYGLKQPAAAPGTTRTLFLCRAEAMDRPYSATQVPQAKIELQADYPPGEHDLGDLVLAEPPLLAAGSVLAPDGRPVAGARVMLQVREGGVDEDDTWWWAVDWWHQTTTGADGSFRLLGDPDDLQLQGRPVRLEAQAANYRPVYASFVPGQSGLAIVLGSAGRLRGSVLVDPGIDPSKLAVHFVPAMTGGRRSGYPASWEGKEFYWDKLEAGTGRVEIRVDGVPEPLVVVDEVAVLDGVENRDPRLQDIDLRGRLRFVRLKFVDENGHPVENVLVTSADPERRFRQYGRDGTMELVVPRELPPLQVTAEGFISELLEDVRGDRRVVLHKGADLEFLLDNPPELPEGWFLALSLQPRDGLEVITGTQYVFDAGGRCLYPAPGAGVFAVHGVLVYKTGRRSRAWNLEPGLLRPETVHIADPRSPASFRLTADPVRLAADLARAQR